ncbi:MAG: hypothetical protein ACQGVC_12820 [Myxococcota bacterium]
MDRRLQGLLASLLGLGLLLLGGSEAAGLRARLSPAGLLIGAHSVVAAPEGRIFVGSDLARVHVYSAQGRPLRGFEVPVARFALRLEGAERLVVVPDDGSPPRAYDFAGEPLGPAPGAAQPSAASDLAIEGGDVVRRGADGTRVIVRGYASHARMLLHTLAVGACLFAGGFLLIGGVLWTGRRVPA